MSIPLTSFAVGNLALAAHAYGERDWWALVGNFILAIGCFVMGALEE